MKKGAVKFFAVVVMFCCLALPAHAGNFKNVVVFGDSLSDNGNVYSLQGGAYPPAPYQGCFSDGPVWVEYLVKSLGISGDFCNYAHGGARTDLTNSEGDPTGFLTQVSAYTGLLTASAAFPTAFPQPQETLFIIWIGGNDFLGDLPDSAAAVMQAVVNIRTGMTQLASAGAVTFMVVNLPDLGQIPRMNQDDVSSTLGSLLAIEFNIALENVLVGFESTYPAIEVVRFNSYGMLNDIIADPEAWRFSNVTDQKLDNGSVAEGRYLFWDDIHPTTITHNILAHRAVALLACDCMGVPRFGADLKLTLPYAELGVDAFGFSLDFCENPAADPDGYYWKLDLESITVE